METRKNKNRLFKYFNTQKGGSGLYIISFLFATSKTNMVEQ